MKRFLLLILLLIFSVTLSAERKAKYEFRENGKYGILDSNGKILLPAEYDAIGFLKHGIIPAVKGIYAVFIKENGEIIDKKICSWKDKPFEKAEYGLIPVQDCKTKKWGLLGKSGEYTVKPIYDDIFRSIEGVVTAVLNNKTVFINIRDKVKNIPEQLESPYNEIPYIQEFNTVSDEIIIDSLNEISAVRTNDKCYFVDINDNKISSDYQCDVILFKSGNLMVVEFLNKIKVIGLRKGEIFTKDKGVDLFATDNKTKLYYIYNIVPQKKFIFDCIKEKIIEYRNSDKDEVTFKLPSYRGYNLDKLFTGAPDIKCDFSEGDNFYLKGNKEMIVDSNGFIKFEREVSEGRVKIFHKEDKSFSARFYPFGFRNLKYNKDPCSFGLEGSNHDSWQYPFSILIKNQFLTPEAILERELKDKIDIIALNKQAIKRLILNNNKNQYSDNIKELKEDNKKLKKEYEELIKKKRKLEQRNF